MHLDGIKIDFEPGIENKKNEDLNMAQERQ